MSLSKVIRKRHRVVSKRHAKKQQLNSISAIVDVDVDHQLLCEYRTWLTKSIINFVVETVGQINRLTCLVVTIYVLQQLQPSVSSSSFANGISSMMTTEKFWGWAQDMVTTQNGKYKHQGASRKQSNLPRKRRAPSTNPTARGSYSSSVKTDTSKSKTPLVKKRHKNNQGHVSVSTTNDRQPPSDEQKQTIKEQNKLIEKQTDLDLYQARTTLLNQIQTDEKSPFVIPDRQCITKILSAQKITMVKTFKLLYSPKLVSVRMNKVIQHQLKTCADLNTVVNKHTRFLAKCWIYHCITQCSTSTDLNQTKWFPNLTRHSHFGSVIQPICQQIISWHMERLPSSNFDIQWYDKKSIHAHLPAIIPYIGHLWYYMKEHGMKQFPVIPQAPMQMPFITIGPDGLYNLVTLSETDTWKEWVTRNCPQIFRDAGFVTTHGATLSWIELTRPKVIKPPVPTCNPTITTTATKANPKRLKQPENDRQLWFRVHGGQHLGNLVRFPETKSQTYCWMFQTNGQEIHFHRIQPIASGSKTTTNQKRKQAQLIDKTNEEKHDEETDEDSKIVIPDPDEEQQLKLTTDEQSLLVKTRDNLSYLQGKYILSNDPGIVNVMSVVGQYTDFKQDSDEKVCLRQQRTSTNISAMDTKQDLNDDFILPKHVKRKKAHRKKLQQTGQTEYVLTNKRYYEMCGMTERRRKLEYWKREQGILELDQQLGQAECRSFDPGEYIKYVKNALNPYLWNKYWSFLRQPCLRKQRFRVYQQTLSAFSRIAHELCCTWTLDPASQTYVKKSVPFNKCILLYGNGAFGPSIKGRSAAPNKKLQDGLKKYMEIYIVGEYNTSKKTGCCHTLSRFAKYNVHNVNLVKYPNRISWLGHKHRDLLYCHSCGSHSSPERMTKSTPWKRDISAALGIYERLYHLVTKRVLPQWTRRDLSL
jgi:hypothetical protein